MSSRRRQVMSSRHVQDVFSVTIFRLPRRLEVTSKCLLSYAFIKLSLLAKYFYEVFINSIIHMKLQLCSLRAIFFKKKYLI